MARLEKSYRTPFEGQRLELLGAGFEFLAIGAPGGEAVKPYLLVDEIIRPALRVGMPRTPCLVAPGTAKNRSHASQHHGVRA
jgi:hypothetical protein